jgi:hypothetical protein
MRHSVYQWLFDSAFNCELLQMKRTSGFILTAIAAMLLQGCLGSGGNSAPAPTNVTVTAKDNRAVVTWDMAPGVEYWIFKAAGTGVTPKNCSTMSLCTTTVKVTSPATIWGLYNGTEYSFTINGRTNGGPGGAGSPSLQATPRLAGATWLAGTATPGTSDLRGVAYGASGAKFVAAGTSGALYSGLANTSSAGITGIAWTAMTNPMPTTNFNAVGYDTAHAKFLAVGAGGAVIAHVPSTSATDWTSLTSNTTYDLYAFAHNGAGYDVATGANGTIITSSDGTTWTLQSSGTTNALNGITYGNSAASSTGYFFVTVGAAGTIRYSSDGLNWTAATSGTASDLKSVTYAYEALTFVAVGANGTVLTSSDGVTWTSRTSISAVSNATLNSVTYSAGRRFVAVATDGNIYYNEYANFGVDWTAVTPKATASPLYSVTTGGLFDYAAVGASGLNFYAD